MAVTFFLTPFVISRLGDVRYGVWVSVEAALAFMMLLDLGIRGAITRYVAGSHATGDHVAASRAYSAALMLRLGLGAIMLAVTVGLAAGIETLDNIPLELRDEARVIVLISGAALTVTFVTGVFGAVLAALHRFDRVSAVALLRTAVIATGTVLLLEAGYGLVALAVLNLGIAAMVGTLSAWLSQRAYPELRFLRARPAAELLRDIASYSAYSFVINLTGSLIYRANTLVVLAFISPAAVTLYSLGARLIDYTRTFANSMAQTLMPVASGFSARGETTQLRRLLVHGTRLALFVAWPIEIALFIRCETFIGLWMGPDYVEVPSLILRILLLSNLFIAGNFVSAQICFGLGRHRPYAGWQAAEAVANVGLSIVLAQRVGLTGVAWAMTLPSLVTNGVIWPMYICRVLELPLRHYLWEAWGRTALALVPFAAVNVLAEYYWAAETLAGFFLQMLLLLPAILLGFVVVFWADVRQQIRNPSSVLWQHAPGGRRWGPRVGRLFER
jgi:O-antigen/teichoic acid export membrane protein